MVDQATGQESVPRAEAGPSVIIVEIRATLPRTALAQIEEIVVEEGMTGTTTKGMGVGAHTVDRLQEGTAPVRLYEEVAPRHGTVLDPQCAVVPLLVDMVDLHHDRILLTIAVHLHETIPPPDHEATLHHDKVTEVAPPPEVMETVAAMVALVTGSFLSWDRHLSTSLIC